MSGRKTQFIEQMNLMHELLAATRRGDWWTHSAQATWAFGMCAWHRHDLDAATRHLTSAIHYLEHDGRGEAAQAV